MPNVLIGLILSYVPYYRIQQLKTSDIQFLSLYILANGIHENTLTEYLNKLKSGGNNLIRFNNIVKRDVYSDYLHRYMNNSFYTGRVICSSSSTLDLLCNDSEMVRNLTITGQNMECVSLYIGTALIDRIYPETFPVLRKLYKMDTNFVPFYLLKIGIPHLRLVKCSVHVQTSDERISASYETHGIDCEKDKQITKQYANTCIWLNNSTRYHVMHPATKHFIATYQLIRLETKFIKRLPRRVKWVFAPIGAQIFLQIGTPKYIELLVTDEVENWSVYNLTGIDDIHSYDCNTLHSKYDMVVVPSDVGHIYCVQVNHLRIEHGFANTIFF